MHHNSPLAPLTFSSEWIFKKKSKICPCFRSAASICLIGSRWSLNNILFCFCSDLSTQQTEQIKRPIENTRFDEFILKCWICMLRRKITYNCCEQQSTNEIHRKIILLSNDLYCGELAVCLPLTRGLCVFFSQRERDTTQKRIH